MNHDARAVANVMIQKAIEKKKPLTPLQVIKLTYLCQAWMLGMYEMPMFKQNIEAWEYGPVIDDVYQEVKKFGSRPVTDLIKAKSGEDFDEYESHILDEVYRVFGEYDGLDLSALTHAEESPWFQTKLKNPRRKNAVIKHDLIRDYYAGQLEQAKRRDPVSTE